MPYDYEKGKESIYQTLDATTAVLKSEKHSIREIDGDIKGKNAIRKNISSIFVDIVNSRKLFKKDKDLAVAKIIRVFTSEVMKILKDTRLFVKMGIRGDCVFAIYELSNKQDILMENLVEIYNIALDINKLKQMINEIFRERSMPTINYGIGIGTSKDLIISVGKKIANDLVFIGHAVVNASILSETASRSGIGAIAIDENTYNYLNKFCANRNRSFEVSDFKKESIKVELVKKEELKYYHISKMKKINLQNKR